MPLQATSGAASYDAFGGGVPVVPNYIEDVFSTYLYTGNGSSQTITNGIDLSGKGGLVWVKQRNNADPSHFLADTARGIGVSGNSKRLCTNTTGAEESFPQNITSISSSGFTIGNDIYNGVNSSGGTHVSWTFRKQPKFFDVVTYTGNGATQNISHNLGSVPGCIMVKRTDASGNWIVWHTSLNQQTGFINLESTAAASTNIEYWNNTAPTSSVFSVGPISGTNGNGATYVAYIFAHNAGGFGLTGTDNVISCGSYTGNGTSNNPITLGYEPQWVLIKRANTAGNWLLFDTMRGMYSGTVGAAILYPNLSDAEFVSGANIITPTATGFDITISVASLNNSGEPYIYIAIRRGPMKVPTTGTSVFAVANQAHSGAPTVITAGFPVDLLWNRQSNVVDDWYVIDRLRGNSPFLLTNSTAAEDTSGTYYSLTSNTTVTDSNHGGSNPLANYMFRRAPSFFDEVCYLGTGSATTFTHNLGVVPELMIVKTRTESGRGWAVYAAPLGATKWLRLELTNAEATVSTLWNNTAPTSSVFTVGISAWTNNNTQSFVNYLFATCAGVSKCFSYTGNGSSQTINCGFTGGARWILIKRTDSTGDWYVWDSVRGIVSGNDPHLSLNTTAAEVTTDDTIDTDSTGFVVNQVSATNVNVSSATYIGLAIA